MGIDDKALVKEITDKVGRSFLKFLQESFEGSGLIWTGELRDSFTYNDITKLISSKDPSAAALEYGTSGGYMPPKKRIKEWVELKLGYKDKELDNVTEAIRMAIYKRGIYGRHYTRDALTEFIQ